MSNDPEAACKAEIARLNKIIRVLCDRAELGVNSEASDFSIFQTTIVLEEKVQARTAELKEALDSLAISNEELDGSLNELKRTQKALVESKKMASLAGLVMGVAHELNTPLGIAVTTVSSIDQCCKALKGDFENDRLTQTGLAESLDQIMQAVDLASTSLLKSNYLISQFKKVSAAKGKPYLVNLSSYIQELCIVIDEELDHPSLSISVDAQSDYLDCVIDENALCNVLSSLMYNSAQHAFSNQSSPAISIQISVAGDSIVINYRDNGSGFDPDIAPKVFDPFFTTARSSGSIGLGLYIVFNIVTEALGGNIELTEWLNGCRYTLTFPRVSGAIDS
jgi:C4-dicarboxylate-specific signal transduction histidine kinase